MTQGKTAVERMVGPRSRARGAEAWLQRAFILKETCSYLATRDLQARNVRLVEDRLSFTYDVYVIVLYSIMPFIRVCINGPFIRVCYEEKSSNVFGPKMRQIYLAINQSSANHGRCNFIALQLYIW